MTNKFARLALVEEARAIGEKMESSDYQEFYGDLRGWHEFRLKEIDEILKILPKPFEGSF